MIPKAIEHEHLVAAATEIDAKGVPANRRSRQFNVEINGKIYPVKYIIALAGRFATGKELEAESFITTQARSFLQARGYKVLGKPIPRPDSRSGRLATIVTSNISLIQSEDEESSFAEGTASFATHRKLERDRRLIKKVKALRLIDDEHLCCEACGFSFRKIFGPAGIGFIEGHHRTPVHMLNGIAKTKVSDIALICSNCHRMIHRIHPMPSIDVLRTMIEAGREQLK